MSVAEPRWSVVIPAYNEAARLPPYLTDVVGYLDGEERLDLLGPLGDHAVRLDRE